MRSFCPRRLPACTCIYVQRSAPVAPPKHCCHCHERAIAAKKTPTLSKIHSTECLQIPLPLPNFQHPVLAPTVAVVHLSSVATTDTRSTSPTTRGQRVPQTYRWSYRLQVRRCAALPSASSPLPPSFRLPPPHQMLGICVSSWELSVELVDIM